MLDRNPHPNDTVTRPRVIVAAWHQRYGGRTGVLVRWDTFTGHFTRTYPVVLLDADGRKAAREVRFGYAALLILCDFCNRPDPTVNDQPDPYAQDVENDPTPVMICSACVAAQADEV